jgi:hypothetical protein
MPRPSDGKMHCDGKSAAKGQPEKAFDACARVHGVPDPDDHCSVVLQSQTMWILLNNRKGCRYGKYTKKSTD